MKSFYKTLQRLELSLLFLGLVFVSVFVFKAKCPWPSCFSCLGADITQQGFQCIRSHYFHNEITKGFLPCCLGNLNFLSILILDSK